jgi:hypothetical protein
MMNQDDQHLKLLSIFHYVVGGLTALFSLFGLVHLIFGLVMILAPEKLDSKGQPPPAFIGWMFAIIGGTIITVGWLFAGFIVTAGRFLARHRHYLFCLVMAGIECMLMPFGTVLGVFTIVVLMRASVKQMFTANHTPDGICQPADGLPKPSV